MGSFSDLLDFRDVWEYKLYESSDDLNMSLFCVLHLSAALSWYRVLGSKMEIFSELPMRRSTVLQQPLFEGCTRLRHGHSFMGTLVTPRPLSLGDFSLYFRYSEFREMDSFFTFLSNPRTISSLLLCKLLSQSLSLSPFPS